MSIALITVMVLLAGCEPQYETDQVLRREIFIQCLQAVPKGPESVQYNDWDEVVHECGNQAYAIATKVKR